jgi:hypothetical protein
VKKGSSAEVGPSDPCRVAACGDQGNSHTRSAQAPTLEKASGSALSLWLWVAAGFLFLGLLWTGMIIAVRQVEYRTVPLAGKEAKP